MGVFSPVPTAPLEVVADVIRAHVLAGAVNAPFPSGNDTAVVVGPFYMGKASDPAVTPSAVRLLAAAPAVLEVQLVFSRGTLTHGVPRSATPRKGGVRHLGL